MSNSLYDMEPGENADIGAWKEWARRLRMRAMTADERKEKAQIEATKLKKEIEEKNGAFIFYKSRIQELENTIENIKRNPAYRSIKFFTSLRGRIMNIFRSKNA